VEKAGGDDSFNSWVQFYPRTKYDNFAIGWFRWLTGVYESSDKIPDYKARNAVAWIKGKERTLTWDGLVDLQKSAAKIAKQYEILETIEFYVNNILHGSYGYKQQSVVAIRSFFSFNRAELPKDPKFKPRADYETQASKLTAEVVRDIIKACKIRDRSLYLTKWMAFLDWEGLQYINTHHGYEIGQQIKAGKGLLGPFCLPGRKQERDKPDGKFYVFIGKDAAVALKEYFETERGYPKPDEPLWLPTKTTREKTPLMRPLGKEAMTMNWLGMVRRLGLVSKQEGENSAYRTGFAGHETRDAASSLIHKCKLQGFDLDVAEFFKGHVSQIDPNMYDKFYLDQDWVKEQYRIIEPYLNILSNWQPENKTMVQEIERLRQERANMEATELEKQAEREKRVTELERLTNQTNQVVDQILGRIPEIQKQLTGRDQEIAELRKKLSYFEAGKPVKQKAKKRKK
jgi:hypothetical protein